VGRSDGGMVFEQAIRVDDPECEGRRYRPRRIVLRLDEPTRNGATEIVLVANLPETVPAELCREVYRGRWAIEGHFQKLTDLRHCEIATLVYPRAALFAFCMSVIAGNALAILNANLRAVHGDAMAQEVSNDALVNEIAEVDPGMMIAVPPPAWSFLEGGSAVEVAGVLNDLAAKVSVVRMLRSRRGPKTPRTIRKTSGSRIHHVATKKLLDAAKGLPPPRKSKLERDKTRD